MSLFRYSILVFVLLAAGASVALGAQAPTVSVSPMTQDADVGQEFPVTATISNGGSESTAPLTAHLEIIDPTRAGSVDAEDWVPDLNTQIGTLAPGESKEVVWNLVPISGGAFAVYVVTLAEGAGSTPNEVVVASPAIPVDVREVRTLNAGGALPVSLAVPLVLLVGLVGLRLRGRRRNSSVVVDA